MDLRWLEIFLKVVELGSFSRAAAATYLTQPTVSEHVKALEESLGLRLLDRLGREVVPTQAGLGISILSRLAAEERLRHGTLAVVAVEGLQLSREFFLVTHRARSLSPLCRAFLSFLLAEYAFLG